MNPTQQQHPRMNRLQSPLSCWLILDRQRNKGVSPMFETSHRENRVVAVSAERLFDVVADVERYPEFVLL